MKHSNEVLVDQNEVPLDGEDTSNDDVAITTPFDTSKIRVETKNTQMDALIKRINNNEINLSPEFQRQGGIWKDDAQSRLIESMLIRIPLPAFYMDASDDDYWLIVDGLQRLTTIRRFVVDEDLVLSGLEFLTDYNGCTFSQLPRSFQRRIEETDVVLYLIQPGTPANVKFDIFRRINTGGQPLSAQEIRHALNQGKITDILRKLSSSDSFLLATNKSIQSKRMDDRECVLRFLAFTFNSPENYSNDNFDLYLNNAMAYANKLDEKKLSAYSEKFEKAMVYSYKIFGNDAFRKRYSNQSGRYPINKALFEAWSVNIGNLNTLQQEELVSKKDILKAKFTDLMRDNIEFDIAISQGTGSVKKVRYRFAKIHDLIMETLNDI
ncbi:DUF262 domain-containing protein [Aeromonas dhakensis]|uniref:DUF262 domain-containing protein n=1 Tax=Aeromonas dhakensis TaxID=196024 RepID=UPI00259FC841|nr:DUF262 domain-containing protein [Aeromonas dhakensis]MDM5055068.1 DUF262 domain-containing protein [Aeromonas dhakensis]MDM5081364.1 DUF262 domain-containing protein [Aeromonas dhakensis]